MDKDVQPPGIDLAHQHVRSAAVVLPPDRPFMEAAKDNRDGKPLPGLKPDTQRVRSCAIELARNVKFKDGAWEGLFRPLGTEPVTV